jgi:hypothetical protein
VIPSDRWKHKLGLGQRVRPCLQNRAKRFRGLRWSTCLVRAKPWVQTLVPLKKEKKKKLWKKTYSVYLTIHLISENSLVKWLKGTPGSMAYTCFPSIWEVEAGGLWSLRLPELFNQTLRVSVWPVKYLNVLQIIPGHNSNCFSQKFFFFWLLDICNTLLNKFNIYCFGSW